MPEDKPNGSGHSRPDSMERLMQTFQNGLSSLVESQVRLAESQAQITIQVGRLIGVVEGVAGALARVVGIVEDIATAQRHMESELADLKDSVRELREAQKHTDERLNALIALVEGFVRRPRVQ
jgi:hypothetical protein